MDRRREFFGLVAVAALFVSGCWNGGATPSAASPAPSAAPPTTTPSAAAVPSASSTAPAATPSPAAPGTAAATSSAAQWVAAGTLNMGRSVTYAVKLTGGNVLVVGEDVACEGEGNYAAGRSVKAEIYNATAGTWTTTGSLNAPRAYFAAEPLANGRALVTAGLTDGGISYSSSKLYDSATGTWTSTGLLHYARTGAAYALLNDGRVLLAGGAFYNPTRTNLSSAEVFDQATGVWSITGSMHLVRIDARAVTLTGGRVLVVGGSPDSNATVTSAELWDPATGAWSNVGSLATNRYGFSLLALPDGSALAAGGMDGHGGVLASAERFNPAALTWSSAGNMQAAVTGRMAAVLPNGKVLFAGGYTGAGGWTGSGTIAAAELYDPASGAWTPTTPLPHQRADGQAVRLTDGSILVVGGDDGPSNGGAAGSGDCRRALPDALRYVPAIP